MARRRVYSGFGRFKLPAGGIVGKIVFGPSQYDARADRIEHDLWRDHQRHLVFSAGSGVQRLEPRLVGEIDLDGSAFKDDDIVAGIEVDGYGGVVSQIASFPRSAGGAEVKGPVEPKAPHGNGMRAAVRAGSADPVVARLREPFFGVAEGQVLFSRFQSVHRRNVGQTYATAGWIGRFLFGRGFLRSFEFRHSQTPTLRSGITVNYFTAAARCRARWERERRILQVRHREWRQDLPAAELFWAPGTSRCSEVAVRGTHCN